MNGERGRELSLTMADLRLRRLQTVLRWLLTVFYGIAGIVHLTATDSFLLIMPDFVPAPRFVVIATGFCEIAGALALTTHSLRKVAGIAFALYAICVFPANLKHAFAQVDVPGLPSSPWYHGPRFLLQPVLVWAALFCADVLRWPFRGVPREAPSR